MANGIVKWFSEKKGYGFIAQEDGPDVFVHHTGIDGMGFKSLKEGDRVTFEIEQGNKGPSAVKVTVVIRSLKGMSGLDRQGIGHVRYRRYGPSREERRTLAAQRAAKRAVENLFIHRYENTLEAS